GRRFIDQQNVRRIAIDTGEKKHALATLREKGQGVHDSIRPSVSSLLELRNEPGHCTALVQAKHERHVFEQNPLGRTTIDKTNNVGNETGLAPRDASGPAGLAHVLTRK